LLERVRRFDDRRRIELRLTQAGRDTVEGIIPLVVTRLNLVLIDFSSREVQELMRLLLKFDARLQSNLEA